MIYLHTINTLPARLRRPNAVGRVLLSDGGSVSDTGEFDARAELQHLQQNGGVKSLFNSM